ncbi:lectin BRA-3-like [Saccostrea echinata]|uniref:lectin BRA-3-like n=1 Tax=Saccostrea echinata TaxID=191078 RepID=UPI002A8115D4|nr:lectin BRA-3-like [Saccostrea echinata]
MNFSIPLVLLLCILATAAEALGTRLTIRESSSGCKAGWKKYQNHCYAFFDQNVNWFQGQMYCNELGGTLVNIENFEENAWIATQFTQNSIWIDATDIGNEGVWRSFSTCQPTLNNWSAGNPNNWRGSQNCATINYGGPGMWDDDNCFKNRPFICESLGNA